MAIQLVNCTNNEYENLKQKKDILIELRMFVKGEIFQDAIVIKDYRDIPWKELIERIEKEVKALGVHHSRCFVDGSRLMKESK